MTGAEFRAALIATAEKFGDLANVNHLTVEPIPGLDIKVASKENERVRRHRYRSVTKSVTEALQNPLQNPPSLSGSSLGSVPDPDPVLPVSSPENLTGNARVAAKKRRTKPRPEKWRRVPADWEPKPEHAEIARYESVTLEREVAKFRDWEFRTARSDADATFRTWLRRAGETQRVNGKPPGAAEHEARQTPAHAPFRREASQPERIDPAASLAALRTFRGGPR
jgi:hypothetical protein